ncbi:MAG: OmpA family protein [Vicingaceae bacterium]|nr:OmpA family protein [Vicingaceae bacterium]
MRKLTLTILSLGVFFNATAQETVLIDEDFNDNSFGWFVENSSNTKYEIKNGHYTFKNKTESSRWVYKGLENISPDEEDWSIEVKFKQKSGTKSSGIGFMHSMYNDNSSYRKFLITANGDLKVDHYYSKKGHVQVDYVENSVINKGYNKYNTLKVVKEASNLTYYINGTQVHKKGGNRYHGYKVGFFTGNKMEMEIDYIKVLKFPKKLNLVENSEGIGEKEKLSANINSKYDELTPIVAADGKTLYVTRDDHPENTGDANDDQDIWISTLDENGEWTPLKNMGFPLNNKGSNFPVSASPDNNSLVIGNKYKADGTKDGSGLSITYKTANGWGIPKTFEIEDYYNDNKYVSYFLCSDNKTLLTSLERKEGLGEKDLYVSFLTDDNKWSKPKHMGKTLNTFGDETLPFLASDNKTLYFSSEGHLGYGNDDVFVSKRLDDSWTNWSEPKNLGPKVNTVSSELGYFLDAKGEVAYFSSGGDIWKIGNAEKPDPVSLISGVTYNKKTNLPMQAEIRYYDLEANVELGKATSDPTTGAYKIILPTGKKYSFIAQQAAFYPISENLDLKDLKEYNEKSKDLYLLPIEKGEAIRLNNIFFEFNKADLKSESFNEIDRLYKILVDNKDMKIEIGGHTDDKGSDEYNRKLSDDRAKSVLNYLAEKGIEKTRLTSKGYGESQPVTENLDDDSRAVNRRVEFKVL